MTDAVDAANAATLNARNRAAYDQVAPQYAATNREVPVEVAASAEVFLRQIGLRSFLFTDIDDEPLRQVWEDLVENPDLQALAKSLGKRLALDQEPV